MVSLERRLFERSKRNVLTLGAASCYPFTSYEMCDNNGILEQIQIVKVLVVAQTVFQEIAAADGAVQVVEIGVGVAKRADPGCSQLLPIH